MSENLVVYSESLNTALEESKTVHEKLGNIIDTSTSFPSS